MLFRNAGLAPSAPGDSPRAPGAVQSEFGDEQLVRRRQPEPERPRVRSFRQLGPPDACGRDGIGRRRPQRGPDAPVGHFLACFAPAAGFFRRAGAQFVQSAPKEAHQDATAGRDDSGRRPRRIPLTAAMV